MKKAILSIALMFFLPSVIFSQLINLKVTYSSIDSIANNNQLTLNFKLKELCALKIKFEEYKNNKDSVYAKILHKIGVYENLVNKDYKKSLAFTFQALRINTSGKEGSSKASAILNYYNIGYYYKALMLLDKSLIYYDSAIDLAQKFKDIGIIIDGKIAKQSIFFQNGDYQKCIEESISGMNYSLSQKDTLKYLMFFNQKAQSLVFQNEIIEAKNDVEKIIQYSNKRDCYLFELATALKTKAAIESKLNNSQSASTDFEQAIKTRIKTKNFGQISYDYIDLGNFYESSKNYIAANKSYNKAIEYATKANNLTIISIANVNLGEIKSNQKEYKIAGQYYLEALKASRIDLGNNILANPLIEQLTNVVGKLLIQTVMYNKTELLLNLFKKTNDKKYLNACVASALLTDTLIYKIRQLQTGNQSKLFWRNSTRYFYANALEACYLDINPRLAFYFMEKSRAVLLNDKLNELGASAHLPINEAIKEDSLRGNIIQQEQQLANLKEGTKAYEALQLELINSTNDLDNHIRLLEQKFPAYYQYKYNDNVPELKELQQSLLKNNQAFIHYFITDSLIYILGITPNNTKLIKVPKAVFNVTQLTDFLMMCADDQAPFKNSYPAYINLSYSIYSILFKPLQIQQKRVVICADNLLIPFGALCTDNTGKHFLIQNHAFSYAYSARSLLKPFNNSSAKGDLLGIAPVTFAPYLQLHKLKESAASLESSSLVFNDIKLLLGNDATKHAFIKLLPNYSVINVFSHARADSSSEEPLLFMADSAIHLSELQKIKSSATQLVVLSACQTNAGKLATGEGIYSLARGFASSGIPSVAATLWKADEDAIYDITQSFDQNLAKGMRKDDALQQAELAFLQHGDEKRHPFFWANMVLVGNAEPVVLSSPQHWVLVISIVVATLLIGIAVVFKKRKAKG